MSSPLTIRRIVLTPVVVPAKADAVNSPEVDHALHMLTYGASRGWTVQFDVIPKVIVRLHTSGGAVGLGENYRGITLEQLEPIARGLIGLRIDEMPLSDLPIPRGRIYDGLECAIVDAYSRHVGVPMHQLLGGKKRDRVRCGYWTGHRTVPDATRKAREGQAKGFDCIKFKCDLDDPVDQWCGGIRDACGPSFRIILDPNRRWESVANTVARARKLEEIGNVLCLEDPIPRWDFQGFRMLREKLDIAIAMHVSLPYAEMGQMPTDVIQAIRHDAVDYFNFNGGIYDVARLSAAAELAGVPFWHGSEVDLGILEASYVHKCAALANATLPSDIFGRLVRRHDLLAQPLRFDGKDAIVPDGPGLGVELDTAALEEFRSGEDLEIA